MDETRSYTCPICKESLPSQDALEIHNAEMHGGKRMPEASNDPPRAN